MKIRSGDWVRLAGAAVAARNSLRRTLPGLYAIVGTSEDAEVRRVTTNTLQAIADAVDGLRHALKDRPARLRREA